MGRPGLSEARLTRWYASHGFRGNRGRRIDFRFRETMVRDPRGPAGARSPALAAKAKGVDVGLAFAPADAGPVHPKRGEYRVRAAAAILEAGEEVKDAVLQLPDESSAREARRYWRRHTLKESARSRSGSRPCSRPRRGSGSWLP